MKYRNPFGQLTLWKGAKHETDPSMDMGWHRSSPLAVSISQCG